MEISQREEINKRNRSLFSSLHLHTVSLQLVLALRLHFSDSYLFLRFSYSLLYSAVVLVYRFSFLSIVVGLPVPCCSPS